MCFENHVLKSYLSSLPSYLNDYIIYFGDFVSATLEVKSLGGLEGLRAI